MVKTESNTSKGSCMKEPTNWLYTYIKGCIGASVRKYPQDKMKWLGNGSVNRMKLWALVLAKQGVLMGDLRTIENSGAAVSFNTQRMFSTTSEGCIWPWEVDRDARLVLEHNPTLDAFPEQRRASEGVAKRASINLADYITKPKQPQIEYIHRPGEQTVVRMTVPRNPNELDINDL